MKMKNISKVFALFLVLALLIPCLPVVAVANTTDYTATRTVDDTWYTNDSDSNATAEDTDDNKFTISSAEQLASFMAMGQKDSPVTFNGKTIVLEKDIYWNYGTASSTGFAPDVENEKQGDNVYPWVPYACAQGSTSSWNQFRGTFDGNNKTIYGLYIANTSSNFGFLGTMRGGAVKDLTIANSYIKTSSGTKNVGMVVGSYVGAPIISNVVIKNCHLNATGGSYSCNLGGICGVALYNNAACSITLNNCVVDSDSTITGYYAVGGLVGATLPQSVITMTDCVNYATVSAFDEVAGLVGRLAGKGTFTRCASFGKVTATTPQISNNYCAASLVAMRYCNNGTDVEAFPTAVNDCKLVKFTDCFYVKVAGSTRDFPIWIYQKADDEKPAHPGFQVAIYYSDYLKEDLSGLQAVVNRAYYKGGSYTTDNESVMRSMYTMANALKIALEEAYPKAILSADAATTSVVKIQGVQTRDSETTGKFDARFVSSIAFGEEVEKTAIKQIGYEISILNAYALNSENHLQTKVCENVYTSILANFGETEISKDKYNADYLATMVVTGIPATGTQSVLLRPFYKTAGGTVYGGYVVVTFVNGQVAGSSTVATTQASANALACSFNESTSDLTKVFPGATILTVKQEEEILSETTVALVGGRNIFEVTYTENGEEKSETVVIARRNKHRVVFNSNGGSYIETKYVENGGKLTYDDSVKPTRAGYEFLGWYKKDGTRFYFNSATITEDLMLVAHWQAPSTPAATDKSDAHVYTTSSAAINIVWKDYANAFSARPASVTCTLSDGTDSYKVVVTENNASFVNGTPAGAGISTGAGNWTVKITGLDGTKNYTFTADDLSTDAYEKQQSGTAVTYTINGYNPMLDDSAWLMTQNGRLYDYAGNVVVLKGVVAYNVGWNGFEDNVSLAALTRLQSEGVNCIRVTVFVENAGNNGYHMAATSLQTEQRRAELRTMLKVAIDNASSLGMYCIVDWGILASIEMSPEVNATAKELFVTLATDYRDNPYVIYEICNEPAPDTWSSTVVPYAEDVIAAIRAQSNALVILAPDAAATNLSEFSNPGDDPIDKPLDTALSYSVAYTYHCYAASHKYNATSGTYYGWKIKDALDAGLTLVLTEFSPAVATMSSSSLTIDEAEANKFLNVILENDMSFMLFRYMSGSDTKDSAQYMFKPNYTDDLNNGTWTYDMLQNSGKWFYDNALDSNGFIKAADFGD